MNSRPARVAMLEQLQAEGVRHMFGNPGTVEQGFLDALSDYPDLRYITTLQETIAVAMADGYARLSGTAGLCSVTQGPGLTNTATSLTVARHHRSPVLLLAGQTSQGDVHNPQRLDQQAFSQLTAGAGAS